MSRLQVIQSDYAGKVSDLNVPQLLLSFIPQNPFADLARAKPTSIISVVIFAAFLGVAALQLFKDEPEKGSKVLNAIDTLQAWVMRLVRLVMKLTPYGVLALMTKVVAMSNYRTTGVPTLTTKWDNRVKQTGLYVQDQIKLDNFILTIGGSPLPGRPPPCPR